MIKRFAAQLFISGCAAAQPLIQIDTSGAEKIGLIVRSEIDAGFSEQVRTILAHPRSNIQGFDRIRRFALALTNKSGAGIAMIGIKYQLLLPDGATPVRTLCLDTRAGDGEAVFRTNTTMIAFPGMGMSGPGFATANGRAIEHELRVLGPARSVRAVIDSVICDSGRATGPDDMGLMLRYRAEIRAVRDLAQQLQMFSRTPDAATSFERLSAALASSDPRPKGPITRVWHDDDYNYRYMQKRIAEAWTRGGERMSLEQAVQMLESVRKNMRDLDRQ